MAQLTKENYEKLKPYERHLVSAYKNSFVHMSGSDFQVVAGIYKDVYGESLTRSQMNCNSCRLSTLRKLGELYSKYTEKETEKETEKKETKRGRPKKLEE